MNFSAGWIILVLIAIGAIVIAVKHIRSQPVASLSFIVNEKIGLIKIVIFPSEEWGLERKYQMDLEVLRYSEYAGGWPQKYTVTITAVSRSDLTRKHDLSFILTTAGTYCVIAQEESGFHVFNPKEERIL